MGGLSATHEWVIVSARDFSNTQDIFQCLDAKTGEINWQVAYPAPGQLDYGNAPRATPLIYGEDVFLVGAMGHLTCVELESGTILWRRDLWKDFGTQPLTWGMCNSPLIVDDMLIVQPGGPMASIVALDTISGDVIWQTAGRPAAYSSFIVATFHGQRQLIGYDNKTLGGWDVETGRRLWELTPPLSNDFNVPTPIQIGDQLFVATENNGARLYAFDENGSIRQEPIAAFDDLAPDTHSPIAVDGKVFGVSSSLFCLDATNNLSPCWISDEDAFLGFATLVGSKDQLLVITATGELVLVSTSKEQFQILDRLQLVEGGENLQSHPAFVDHHMFIRIGRSVSCLSLDEAKK